MLKMVWLSVEMTKWNSVQNIFMSHLNIIEKMIIPFNLFCDDVHKFEFENCELHSSLEILFYRTFFIFSVASTAL